MTVIVCVDDKGGMAFHGRRQSQDRVLREYLMTQTNPQPIWMSPYSASQFEPQYRSRIQASEDFLERAGSGSLCFVENQLLPHWESRLEQVILFRWNRVYPADTWLDLPLEAHGWHLVQQKEFPGYSHKRITQEVYKR